MSDPASENPEFEPTRENVNPQSIEGLFLMALEKKTPAERTAFLDEICGDNLEKRRRVEALLLAYDDAGSFLEKSPVGSGDSQSMNLDFLTPSEDPNLLGSLGEYQIYDMIGQGGMGIVFRALDPKLNRIVAIKVMSPLLAVNPNAKKRFLREAQAAAAVSHPHIVTIHAVDEDKLPYLVMEYVVGQSLQQKLDKVGSLKVTEILRIGSQIAEGLAAAHKQGLIHRDIKPANILLENGVERVKITDFGLARAVDDVTITKTGEVSGTPQYMSPEQASGDRVDQRSDLFSLGAVLYAMCTGRSPFRASNLAAVVRRVCDDKPRPIQEVNEDIPEWLSEIIDCLLEKQPENRTQTAEEVADLLGTHLARLQHPGYTPEARPPRTARPLPQQKIKVPQAAQPAETIAELELELRNKTPGNLVGGILLAIGVGIFLAFSLMKTGSQLEEVHLLDKVVKVSGTLVAIMVFSTIIYLVRGTEKRRLPAATWFLCLSSLNLTLFLTFVITVMIRTRVPLLNVEPDMYQVLVASLIALVTVSGFAIYQVWRFFQALEPSQFNAMQQRDVWLFTTMGIGIWVLLVLWNWAEATGIIQPLISISRDWQMIPVIVLAVLGGLCLSVGFWLDQNLKKRLGHSAEDELEIPETLMTPQGKRGSQFDRIVVGVGAVLLVLPLLIWLFGISTGLHFTGSVSEMALVSTLFFVPVGLLVMICGAQNLVEPNTRAEKVLDGLFLLACLFAGPIGILLYIARYLKRRDARAAGDLEQPPVTSGDDPFAKEHRRSNKRVIIGVMVGLLLLLSSILFVQISRHLNTTEQGYLMSWGLNLLVVSMMLIAAYFIRRKGAEAASRNPWIVLEWVTILVACLMLLALVLPTLGKPIKDQVILQYHGSDPISNVIVETDRAHMISSWPYELKMKPGVHHLKFNFTALGHLVNFYKKINKQPGEPLHVDLTSQIQALAGSLREPPPVESQPDGPGAILISGQTPYLRVGIFPIDSPDGGDRWMSGQEMGMEGSFGAPKVYGFADRFFTLEPMTHELPAGKYLIKVSSTLAGWARRDENPGNDRAVPGGSRGSHPTYGTPQYELKTVAVKPGEIVSVTIKPDYSKLAENHPDWSQGGLFKFHWARPGPNNLKIYTLSLPQALIVQELLQAYADGKPDVAESTLLKVSEDKSSQDTPQSLDSIFNAGQHPAWKTLIKPGKATDYWRLAEPMINGSLQQTGDGRLAMMPAKPFGEATFENNRSSTQQQQPKYEAQGADGIPPSSQQPLQAIKPRPASQYGAVVIFGKDPGMRIDLEQEQTSDSNGRIMKRFQRGASTFDVTPGEYVIKVSTELIGWELSNRSAHYIDSELKVKAGETLEKTLQYNFQKLAENHPIWEADQKFHFQWPDPNQGVGMEFEFSQEQAQVVQNLLEAFAIGKPDVSETSLLSVANQSIKSPEKQLKSLEDLFLNQQSPDWKLLIIPDKSKKTWRLVDPQFKEKSQSQQPKAS
ncbi:serine/threonine-protein kinase [Gimesia sp.]|uniref:serine/threonine-protein kinase n=1 Tax=Gimesia sp. TaxID=2024833 RepID=UPI003A91BA4C